MTALGLLHLLNEAGEKPIVYISVSDGNADYYFVRGEPTVIQIDWDWVTNGDADADDIEGLIDTIERDWPDGAVAGGWLQKAGVLAELRTYLPEDEDLDPGDDDDTDPLF